MSSCDGGSVTGDGLRARFKSMFGGVPHIFAAPGRVNLIGEHTDYNDGFVMPAAIRFLTLVACTEDDSGRLTLNSLQQSKGEMFSLAESQPNPRGDWTDYVRGVQLQLRERGCTLSGAKLLVSSEVPMGAGLSSSAALEIATALSLLHPCGLTLDKLEIAKLARNAENEFVGARCGIMDQFASLHGRAGHSMLLDCRSLTVRYVPIPRNVTFVICNSMVRHSLASSEYNLRRTECEQCVTHFARFNPGVKALRDLTLTDIEQNGDDLSNALLRRARHVVSENERVLLGAEAMLAGDLLKFGSLMYDSHASLRDDYEVSCAELNLLVEIARRIPGVYGGRMTGGGFGGCTISLVERAAADEVVNRIRAEYEAATNIRPGVYVTDAADGAHAIP